MEHHELIILEIVGQSDGRQDTRQLDFEYYSRSKVLLEPHLLQVLRDFEQRDLVESVAIAGGTGPGWTLTDEGRAVLDAEDPTAADRMTQWRRLRAIRGLMNRCGSWAIRDDCDRDQAVETADSTSLRELVTAVGELPDEVWQWLAEPEGKSPGIGPDYYAVTNITMAADLARVILEQ